MAPIVLAAAATAYQSYSGYQEGKSEQAMAEYNARLSERQAKEIEAKTRYDQERQAQAAARGLSTMQTKIAQGGAVADIGSPLLAMAEQASEYELENLMIGREGSMAAGQARSQAEMERMKAKAAGQRARSSLIGGALGTASTLLGGFDSPETKDQKLMAKHYKNAGIFSR